MSTELVTVGCRLPLGVELEIGYTVNDRGQGGTPFATYRKSDSYQSFTLKGTNQNLIVRDQQNPKKIITTLPARAGLEPFINQVPKDFWDAWVKKNEKSWLLRSGQIFVVPSTDGASIAAASMDAQAQSAGILQPLDPNATLDFDGIKIEKRKDE